MIDLLALWCEFGLAFFRKRRMVPQRIARIAQLSLEELANASFQGSMLLKCKSGTIAIPAKFAKDLGLRVGERGRGGDNP